MRPCFTLAVLIAALGLAACGTSTTAVAGAATTGVHVSYGSSPYQTMVVYPADKPNAALVVLVHGGGWDTRPGSYLGPQAKQLQSAGFAVFSVNYDTVVRGHGAFPPEINDVVAATRWAMAHATAYDADPRKVEMVGGSAGGQLVGMAAEELDASAAHAVTALVTLSGALDFVKKIQDIEDGTVRGYDAFHAQQALGCRIKNGTCTTSLETEWSPAKNVTTANCPTDSLIINSSHESEPVDQAVSMTSALRAHGCAVTELIRNGRSHSFAYWKQVFSTVRSFLTAA